MCGGRTLANRTLLLAASERATTSGNATTCTEAGSPPQGRQSLGQEWLPLNSLSPTALAHANGSACSQASGGSGFCPWYSSNDGFDAHASTDSWTLESAAAAAAAAAAATAAGPANTTNGSWPHPHQQQRQTQTQQQQQQQQFGKSSYSSIEDVLAGLGGLQASFAQLPFMAVAPHHPPPQQPQPHAGLLTAAGRQPQPQPPPPPPPPPQPSSRRLEAAPPSSSRSPPVLPRPAPPRRSFSEEVWSTPHDTFIDPTSLSAAAAAAAAAACGPGARFSACDYPSRQPLSPSPQPPVWALSGLESELLGFDGEQPSEDSAGSSEMATNEAPPPGCAPDAVKLFVGNIPKTLPESQLLMLLELVGKVVQLEIKRARFTHIAFVWYATREAAEHAIVHFKAMRHVLPNLSEGQGKPLVVRRAKARVAKGSRHGAAGGSVASSFLGSATAAAVAAGYSALVDAAAAAAASSQQQHAVMPSFQAAPGPSALGPATAQRQQQQGPSLALPLHLRPAAPRGVADEPNGVWGPLRPDSSDARCRPSDGGAGAGERHQLFPMSGVEQLQHGQQVRRSLSQDAVQNNRFAQASNGFLEREDDKRVGPPRVGNGGGLFAAAVGTCCSGLSPIAPAMKAAPEYVTVEIQLKEHQLPIISGHVRSMVGMMTGAQISVVTAMPEHGPIGRSQLVIRGTVRQAEAARSMIGGMIG